MPKKLTVQERFNRAAAVLIRRMTKDQKWAEAPYFSCYIPTSLVKKALDALEELE